MATLATDTWTGTNGAAWSQWTRIGTTGTYTIQANQGQMVTSATAFQPTASVLSGMTAAVDQELLVDVGFASVAESYIMVAARTDGTMLAGDVLPTNGFYVLMRTALNDVEIGKMTGGTKTILATVAKTYSTTTRINVRLRVVGSVFSARLWNVGVTEPSTWDYTATVTTPYLTAGRPMVGGNTNGTRTVTFDNLTVTDGVASGLALDASTPAAVATTTAAPVSTASFTPPSGSILVAHYVYNTTNTGSAVTISNSGTALTWNLIRQVGVGQNGGVLGGVYVAWAHLPTSRALTVTAAQTVYTEAQAWLRVRVITGANTVAPIGAVGGVGDTAGTFSQSLVTTAANSWVWGAVSDWDNATVLTPGSGCTLDAGQSVGTTTFVTAAVVRATAITPASGTTVTISNTTPSSTKWNVALYELKADTGTVPVSTSRATTWRTDAPITVAKLTNWSTFARTATTRASSWSVAANAADVYTDTYSDTYGVSALTSVPISRVTTWGTFTTTTATRATAWSVASTLIAVPVTRTTSWGVIGRVVVTRATSWTARAAVAPTTRQTTWAVLTVVPAVTRTSSWETFSNQSGTTATTTPGARLRVYAWNGADLGPLPAPIDVNVSYPLDDVGALTFNYFKNAPRAALLGQPCEIAVEFSPNGGVTWVEPPSSRFVYTSDGSDPLDPSDKLSVTARAYVGWQLSGAVVLPNNLLNNAGKRGFLSSEGSNPGVILKTLLNEAQARGALPGLVHSSFSTTLDSAGNAWSSALTIYYEPGLPYMTVLQNLADQGFIDFRTQGRSLYVYNAEATMAVDRTVGATQVTLRAGRDLTEAPFRRTYEALANFAYFAGDGTSYEYLNPSAETPYGRREVFISNGSVSDPGTMATLTQAELSQRDAPRTEYTRGLDFARAVSLPFWDYGVGDYVWSAVDGTGVARLRVRQITLSVDNGIVAGNVVLNDRFLESDVRARRRIEGITNGAQSGTGTGGPVYVPGEDTVSPGRVQGLTGTSAAYMGPGGFPVAQASLSWTEIFVNENGTPITDLSHYEVYQRPLGESASLAEFLTTTPINQIDLSPYVVGSNWVFNVAAVDTDGHRGEKSVDVLVGMAVDTVPPQAPSAPVGSQRLGLVVFAWDGLPATGTWPEDFHHVEVHTSVVNNFTPTDATLTDRLYGEGTSVVSGAAFGVPLFCKLVAVDTSALKSPASAQGSATPTRLVGSDLDPGAITYEQLAFKDPGNVVPDGSLETAGFRSLLAGRSAAAWTFTQADRFHGDWCATINAAVNPSTNRALVLMTSAERQQIVATDKLFCRFAYKGTSGATGVLQLTVEWTAQDGTVTWSSLPGTLMNGTWQQAAGQLTAPANCQDFRIYVELSAGGTIGVFSVDAVEVRRTVATEFIEDAAITRALIQDLAVNDAKIATLSVGKITAGTMAVDMVIAGRMMTSASGSRVQIDGTGIRLFQGTATTPTVFLDPVPGQLKITNSTDASLTSTGHGIQFGANNAQNLIIDDNEIMVRNNSSYGVLFLNREGGRVVLGGKVGGFPFGQEGDGIPKNANHQVRIDSALFVQNSSIGDYADEFPPFSIGKYGDQHIWMDKNSIGAVAGGDFLDTLYINPRYANGTNSYKSPSVVLASNSIAMWRIGDNNAAIRGWTGIDSAVQFIDSEVRITAGNTVGYATCRGNFVQSSSVEDKEDITDFDPLAIVRGAKSRRWKYKDDKVTDPERYRYGPMAESLPAEVVSVANDGATGIDLGSLLGVHHEALRVILDRLEKVEARGSER